MARQFPRRARRLGLSIASVELPPYPDLSEPRLVATRADAAYYPQIKAGALNDGQFPRGFELAVAARWVPHSEEGYFRYLAWGGASAQQKIEAGLSAFYGFGLGLAGHSEDVAAQSLAAQQGAAWGSLLDPDAFWAGYAQGGGMLTGGGYVPHPVLGFPVHVEDIAYDGPYRGTDPASKGLNEFLLKDGRSWLWAPAGYVAPAGPRVWTGKVAIDLVLLHPQDPPPYRSLAVRQQEYMSDGTIEDYGWRPEGGAYEAPEDFIARYSGPGETIEKYGSTVRVRFFPELSAPEQQTVLEDLGILALPLPQQQALVAEWLDSSALGPVPDLPAVMPTADETPGMVPPSPGMALVQPSPRGPIPAGPLPGGEPVPSSGSPALAGLGTFGKLLLGGVAVGGLVALLGQKKKRRPRGYTSNRRR